MSWWLTGAAAASTLYGAYSDSQGNRQDARNGYVLGGLFAGGAGAAAYGGGAAAGAAGGGGGMATDGLAVNLGTGSSGMGTLSSAGLDTSGSLGAAGGGFGGVLSGIGNFLGSGSGSNLLGGLGNFFGGQQQSQGYANASDILGQLGQQAGTASQISDPFQQYRGQYATQLNDILSGKQSIQTDPGYQFAQQQGQQAVQRSAAAQGLGQSGNVMAALQQRGQDVANQQYGNIISRLTGLAGATPQNAQAGGAVYSNLIGQSMAGQASAAVGQGMSNAAGTSGGIAGLGGLISGAAGLAGAIGGLF